MLQGVKIIDFTQYLPGPFSTQRLAELGADVIKVEPPTGDPARHTGTEKDGGDIVFRANNRKKRSISLNLKENKDRETVLSLIANADVIVESFRPGVMKKLGLSYEEATKANPGIVYCSITGYGLDNHLSQQGSHDLNYMALSGVLAQLKDKKGKPVHPSITIADYVGGLVASERVLAGLIAKARTGIGGYHCISIADALVSFMGNHLLLEKETGLQNGISILNGEVVSYGLYETKDNRFVSLAALEPKFWSNFCIALNKPDWVSAHFSQTNTCNPVYLQMKEIFISRTLKEWTVFSRQVDCCMAPVLEVGELHCDPFFEGKETILDGYVKMHSDLNSLAYSPPPKKGEHTAVILNELDQESKRK